jgi:CBS domain-containing protein
MQASDVMTRTVTCVDEHAPIAEALHLMLGKAIGALPVIDSQNQLVGIITEGDLLRRAEMAMEQHAAWWKNLLFGQWYAAREYVHSHVRSVGSIMTRETLCIAEDTPLSTIVQIMEQEQVKRLPVTSGRKVIGIVTRRDVLRSYSSNADKPFAATPSDAKLLAQIDAELVSQRWSPLRNIEISSEHGVVSMVGTVSRVKTREALRDLVRKVPGVRDIHDELLVTPGVEQAS